MKLEQSESFNFRRRVLFSTLFPVFGIPIILSQLLLLSNVTATTTATWTARAILAVLTVLFYNTLWVLYSDSHNSREARRMGAQLVTPISGRLPGNVDILYEFLRRGESFLHGRLCEGVV